MINISPANNNRTLDSPTAQFDMPLRVARNKLPACNIYCDSHVRHTTTRTATSASLLVNSHTAKLPIVREPFSTHNNFAKSSNGPIRVSHVFDQDEASLPSNPDRSRENQ